MGGVVRLAPDWLPTRVARSVLRWASVVRLPSVIDWFRDMRATAGGLAALSNGPDRGQGCQADLARWFGVSRSAVTQACQAELTPRWEMRAR